MNFFNSSSGRIKKDIARNYYSYLIYLYAFLLPLPNNLKSGALILLALVWLVNLKRNASILKSLVQNRVFLSFLFLYALYLLSFFLSQNKKEAVDFIILLLSVPLLPLLFYEKLTKEQVKKAVLIFTISILIVSLFALYKTYSLYFHSFPLTPENLRNLDWAYFSFSLPISISFHAPYFSLYMGIGLVILLSEAINKWRQKHFVLFLIYILLSFYFFAFIALLSSRTALFATVAVIAVIAAAHLLRRRRYLLLIILFVSIAAGTYTAYRGVPYLHDKMSSFAGSSERAYMWHAAIGVINENPLFGVGTGDNKEALLTQYRLLDFERGIEAKYNVHNQYLDIAVSLGLLGLFALVLCMATILQVSIKEYNPILLAFILIFALCCVTESLMHRQAGVVLFSFFSAIFVFANKPSEEE